jgi:cytoplasmic iron level regulating protein YaaA (DUF328/UPF0246 family)
LDLAALSFPELTPFRKQAISALRTLSRNLQAATGALGLGRTQRFEIDRNRTLTTSPVMPAIERYTGVLFDGLDAATLTPEQRAFAAQHVVIHSALFGLIGADDPIPAYRLSHNSRLPKLSLRKHWREPISAVLGNVGGIILDLRSESYAELGPAPADSWYVRVVSEDARGRLVALSHFNKKSKGEFTRAVIQAGLDHDSVESLLAWAGSSGIRLERGAPGELDLVVGE